MLRLLSLFFVFILAGCNLAERLSTVGSGPQVSQIKDPTTRSNYQPVIMPMPGAQQQPQTSSKNSLWLTGAKAFFKDQRAKCLGDIVMVEFTIDQKQSMAMSPKISRKSTGSSTVTNALGFERKMEKFFPKKQNDGISPNSSWFNYESNPQMSATAKYDISDKMTFKIAATVIQILPNGNMVIHGRQEIKLINEVREIELKGIVRREDISGDNMVKSDKIAELRVQYGGRGDLSDMQEFPWGQQIANKVLPFG